MGGRGGGGRPNEGIQFGVRGRGGRCPQPALCGVAEGGWGAEPEEWQEHVGAGAGVWSWGSSCHWVCVLDRNATMLHRLEPLERKRVRCRIASAAAAARRFVFSENVQSVGNESVVENEKPTSWVQSYELGF